MKAIENYLILLTIFVVWILINIIRLIYDYFLLNKPQILLVYIALSFIALLICVTYSFIGAAIILTAANITYYWIVKPKLLLVSNNDDRD